DLMRLLAFPGGYGGMVHCEDGRVSISCCIRRATLARIHSGPDAARGGAVIDYIIDSCRGVRQALAGARREGTCLAAGPIRPGIRLKYMNGIFSVGNAAGEAHPVVAEGISMAMQSAWLLAERLIAHGTNGTAWDEVAADYARAWRCAFVPRLRAAAVFAHWAMRPAAVSATLPLLQTFP